MFDSLKAFHKYFQGLVDNFMQPESLPKVFALMIYTLFITVGVGLTMFVIGFIAGSITRFPLF
jgi:hypothetical protein